MLHLPVLGSGDGGIYSTAADLSRLLGRALRRPDRPAGARRRDAATAQRLAGGVQALRPRLPPRTPPATRPGSRGTTRACRSSACTTRRRRPPAPSSRTGPGVPGRSSRCSRSVSGPGRPDRRTRLGRCRGQGFLDAGGDVVRERRRPPGRGVDVHAEDLLGGAQPAVGVQLVPDPAAACRCRRSPTTATSRSTPARHLVEVAHVRLDGEQRGALRRAGTPGRARRASITASVAWPSTST